MVFQGTGRLIRRTGGNFGHFFAAWGISDILSLLGWENFQL
jgi:hypothetical protein